ncbi:hypothetical protein Bbelb_370500 [Branchiostoma belcheri]|nr:hypothetical protein Bbelb_370500 [Branchiostoma belcheri]
MSDSVFRLQPPPPGFTLPPSGPSRNYSLKPNGYVVACISRPAQEQSPSEEAVIMDNSATWRISSDPPRSAPVCVYERVLKRVVSRSGRTKAELLAWRSAKQFE